MTAVVLVGAGAGLADALALARRASDEVVVLAATCAPVVELAPRLADEPGVRAAVDAAGARVLELRDHLRGQHPLAWAPADLEVDAPVLRAAVGTAGGAVDLVVLPGVDDVAVPVGDVLRAVWPAARVVRAERGGDGLVAVDVPPAAAVPVPRRRGRLARGLTAARVRAWEATVVVRAAYDVRRAPAGAPGRPGGGTR
ncbi:hypothetical protein [Cellulomonas composti]|uniref:Uncharacterized protein n=1 Tax=Cellulomonas composti TaxID=266130 RepID=A0A511JBK8_9CELL|nr:hypothetical protein [Cellulomonas composti]GEL95189.1 hypothetical protein CCO02nite_18470 [Cellulomonas composti]